MFLKGAIFCFCPKTSLILGNIILIAFFLFFTATKVHAISKLCQEMGAKNQVDCNFKYNEMFDTYIVNDTPLKIDGYTDTVITTPDPLVSNLNGGLTESDINKPIPKSLFDRIKDSIYSNVLIYFFNDDSIPYAIIQITKLGLGGFARDLSEDRYSILNRGVFTKLGIVTNVQKLFNDTVTKLDLSYKKGVIAVLNVYGNINGLDSSLIERSIRVGVDNDSRKVLIQQLSKGKKDSETLVFMHGWINDVASSDSSKYIFSNYYEKLGNVIKGTTFGRDKQIITVNAVEPFGFEWNGYVEDYLGNMSISVENAALWVNPTASVISNYFKTTNFDVEHSTFICHSLGAYLCNETILKSGKIANGLIIVDIADTPSSKGMDLDLNTNGVQNNQDVNLSNTAKNSQSFSGLNSLAGNKNVASSTNLSLLVDYGTPTKLEAGSDKAKYKDLGKEHSRLNSTVQLIYTLDVKIPVENVDNALDVNNSKKVASILDKNGKFIDKETSSQHSAILTTRERYISSGFDRVDITDEKDSNTPRNIINTNTEFEEKDEACKNTTYNDTVYDSNKNNLVIPYSLTNETDTGCDILKGDGGNDTFESFDKPSVMYGESGDDSFKLRYNGSIVYVRDFGVGGDKLLLEKNYEGHYSFEEKSDGSIDIKVDRFDKGGDILTVGNIKGSSIAKFKELKMDAFNEKSNLIKYIEEDKND